MSFSLQSGISWVIFDVDGVLVDTSESYDLAVKHTVEAYLASRGIQIDVKLDYIRLLRTKGSFGDDFDLCEALILGAQFGDLESFVEKFPSKESVDWVRDRTHERIVRNRLFRYFNTLYLGNQYPERLFDHEGFWKNEKPLVDVELLRSIESAFKIGVVTGRDRMELNLAEKIISYHFQYSVTRDEVLKPNPEALELICGISTGVYVGDTLNDGMLVERYNKRFGKDLFAFIMVGKDVESVNDFLRFLLQ